MNLNKTSVFVKKIKFLTILGLALSMSLFLVNCTEEDDEDFVLGEEYIESQTAITRIDTFDVDLSTVKLDSVATSNTGVILLGDYSDDAFGSIHCNSYMELGVPDTFIIDDDDTYDSLTFAMTYSGYSFGDTTQSRTISIHRVTEKIKISDEKDYLYSDQSFSYDPEPLGTVVYTPRPNNPEQDSVTIRLDDALGKKLYKMFYNLSDSLSDDEVFLQWFYGIVLVDEDSDGGSIIGFNGDEDEAAMIMHVTAPGYTKTHEECVFPIVNASKQFNSIEHDFSSTALDGLESQDEEMPSSESNNLAYAMAGVGLAVRVDCPSLQNVLMLERGTVIEADLLVAPVNNDNDAYDFDLPSSFTLDEVAGGNLITESGISSSILTLDDSYDENTYYVFDITDYIQDAVDDAYFDPDKGFLITLPSSYLKTRFDRAIFDASSNNTQLRIYYMTY